jgi:hypothetical protein
VGEPLSHVERGLVCGSTCDQPSSRRSGRLCWEADSRCSAHRARPSTGGSPTRRSGRTGSCRCVTRWSRRSHCLAVRAAPELPRDVRTSRAGWAAQIGRTDHRRLEPAFGDLSSRWCLARWVHRRPPEHLHPPPATRGSLASLLGVAAVPGDRRSRRRIAVLTADGGAVRPARRPRLSPRAALAWRCHPARRAPRAR